MKKLFLLLAFTLPAFAQSNRVYNASTYAYTTQVNGGNPSTGSSSLSASPTAFAQGIPFSPYNTNASISINRNAANAETVTPSAVTNCFPNGAGCTLSSTFTFKHITGESIQSGTFGLQEAINIAMAAGSGTVLIDSTWQGPAGASLITAAKGNNNVMIQDNRNPSGAVFYQWGGSAYAAAGGGSGSQVVIYASKIAGVTSGVAVVPGSSATGTTDSAAAINAAIAGGNVDLEVDSGFALSTPLVISSNTTIHCTSPQYGFIMQIAANASVMINAHQNSPTTASGTGGFLPSNIVDNGIAVRGCTINGNSTQAVTGVNSQGTAHGATPGGLFTYGVYFVAVNALTMDSDDVYDTGCWGAFFSNVTNLFVNNNYIHQPTPTVTKKFTDALHIIGPAQWVYWTNNHLRSGDDALALNADDGNRPGSGDVNASYVQSFVKWGPILDVHIQDTTFDLTDYGLRIFSSTELIDRIFVSNTEGTTCGNNGLLTNIPAIGPGNIGKVVINGWSVTSDGTCNVFAVPYNFQLSANIQNLEIANLSIANPGVNWPIITQTAGTIGTLSLHNWNVYTTSSTFSNLIALSAGAINQIQTSGINWYDTIGTGSVFSGAIVPTTVTVSNYSGPNRLLAGGFAPTFDNGDAFTNTYPTPTVYVNTTFNEQTTGTALAASTPATCTNGCTGTWTAAAGGPSSGAWRYTTNSATLSGSCVAGGPDNFCPVYINAGIANYTLRVTISQFDTVVPPGFSFAVRWTNNNNFVTFVENSPGVWGLYDVVAGVTTSIGSATLGNATGVWTVVMNGTTAKLISPSGTTMTGTVSGSNTATNVGLSNNGASVTGSDIITAFSVKSF